MNNWKDIPCSQTEVINITEIFLKLIDKFGRLAKKNSIRLHSGPVLINDNKYLEEQAHENGQKNPEKELGVGRNGRDVVSPFRY